MAAQGRVLALITALVLAAPAAKYERPAGEAEHDHDIRRRGTSDNRDCVYGRSTVVARALSREPEPENAETLSPRASNTLEPRRPGRGFGMKFNWPGLAMVAAGFLLLLIGAAT
jgi:hypothetical protein